MSKLCYFSLWLSLLSFSTHSSTLKVNAIDWCPQLCTDFELNGYVMDTVDIVFKESPYELEAKTYPWTRAILGVYNGKSHALLSPAKNEAPQLLYPQHPIGVQRMCFFTSSSSNWKYTGLKSLKGMKIGIAYDTSIAELNDYVAEHKDQFEFFPYNHKFITRNLNMVSKHRINAFLFTYNSTVFTLKNLGLRDEFKEAGCVSSEPIYMAFSPNPNQASQIAEIMLFFDQRMQKLKSDGEISRIMARYGLEDWQTYLPNKNKH
ncbi:transporter substrate-binding domain-containing protein [Vibrio makurazakiensis]|uniref:hypothetical protein n=1 Tax=Vibrio makurazakiensis TaxID=2910250 RepID=UPI003D1115A5